jgi:hypothetical protein
MFYKEKIKLVKIFSLEKLTLQKRQREKIEKRDYTERIIQWLVKKLNNQ